MSGLIDAALERSRVVILALVFLLISGITTYIDIPKEADPDVNIPIIYVSMTLDGVSPEDAERLMVRPMEEEVRSIEGIKEMTASAFEGGAYVVLEFEGGFDTDTAILDVREAVDRVRPDLPDDMEEPTVTEVTISLFPVIVVLLSGELPERTLVSIARDLRDEIEGVSSVLRVNIGGDREEVVEVVIDPLLVESYGLNGNDVATIVSRSNLLIAAGTIDTGTGRFAVKVPGLINSLEDILDIPVAVDGDAVVRFADIASIRRTFEDPEGFARLDGRPAVALEVLKRSGENIIDTVEAVRAVIDRESALWPDTLSQTIEVTYSQDQSRGINTMLLDLQNNVISAVLLVMIVIVGALGLRSAALVGIAIPGSFLTGILVLGVMGLTVNIVVLFSLILAVGMLVDGAIVVTEYADRKMAEGSSRREAYALAAKRMAWPISASTLTTLAAFMPLLFWPGIVGEFMRFMPITLSATLAASLLMALVFVPTLGAQVGRSGGASGTLPRAAEAYGVDDARQRGGAVGLYLTLLSWALRHPGLVLTGAAATLIGVWMAFAVYGRGVEFFPDVEPEQAVVIVHARGNLSIHERDALVREVEAEVLRFGQEFSSVYSRTTGGDGGPGLFQDIAEDSIGIINLEFRPWGERRPASDVLGDIREATAALPGIVIETREPEEGPPVGKPIQIELSARDPTLLPDAVATLRAYMETLDGLVDIEDDRPIPGIEWQITVDRAHAARFDVDVALVGDAIQLITNGLTIGTYRPNDSDDEVDINVRYPTAWRSIEQLGNVRIVNDAGHAVPISNFVEQQAQPLVGTLNRVDSRRVMTIAAELAPNVLADDMVQAINAWLLSEGHLDSAVDYRFRGEDEEQRAAAEFLSRAFAVALFMMAIILVTQFNSFYSAFLILSAVIMSTVGVLIGLLVTGQPFGIVMTGVGVIALAGIVVNNNIVLIDTFDRIKRETPDVRSAILETGAQRLRPVVLTSVTTILGLMPMVLSANIDFLTREVSVGAPSTQWWVGLATAIVFGLAFATILTLVVTPCALMLRGRIVHWRSRRRRTRQSEAAASATA